MKNDIFILLADNLYHYAPLFSVKDEWQTVFPLEFYVETLFYFCAAVFQWID